MFYLSCSLCFVCFPVFAYKFLYFVTSLLLKCYWVTKKISIFAIGNKIKT